MTASDQPANELAGIRAVFFDVGETLIDETREYGTWADWIGVPRHTFSVTFGAILARGEDYREVFEHFVPGFNLAAERQRRIDAGIGEYFNALDLYPDAKPALSALSEAGYFVGIAGNQTSRAGQLIHELGFTVDLIATSDDWGAEKPSLDFFHKLVSASGFQPCEILYVGDRLDNDIKPAKLVGLKTAFIQRGPWANAFPLTTADVTPSLTIRDLGEILRHLDPRVYET